MQKSFRRSLWVSAVFSATVCFPFWARPVAYAASYEDTVQQLNDVDRMMRDEDQRFAQETAGMTKGGRQYKQAQDKHEATLKQLRNRKASLRDQAERARNQVGQAAVADKLENNGDAINNEKKRHAEAMKHLPAGSAAAQSENQRYEDRMRELTNRRQDLKEDVASVKEVRQSTLDYKKDVGRMKQAVDAENQRHAKAMKFLPANSLAAQEEDRAHAQKLQQIQEGIEAAGDRREMTVSKVSGDKAVDGELDSVNAQIAQEKARHDRRMAQVMNGSAAAAQEDRQYAANMARLGQQQADLQSKAAGARGSAEQKYALKRQLDDIDQQLAAENARFDRRLNDIDAGSEMERLERDRHTRVVEDLNNRRAQTVATLNGGVSPSASGR